MTHTNNYIIGSRKVDIVSHADNEAVISFNSNTTSITFKLTQVSGERKVKININNDKFHYIVEYTNLNKLLFRFGAVSQMFKEGLVKDFDIYLDGDSSYLVAKRDDDSFYFICILERV